MPEIDRIDQLQPYKSLVLARIRNEATLTDLIADCLADVEDILDLADEAPEGDEPPEDRTRVKMSKDPESVTQEGLVHGYLHYQLRKPVSWAEPDEIRDVENHLVLLTRKRKTDVLALYASENTRRRAIRREFGTPSREGLTYLAPVAPERLNSAFFGETVRTLWLSGMHRRVPVKADAKVLSGQDLKFALDPLNDQTFYFTAARSRTAPLGAVGLSPKKSRIWTRPSRDWTDYRTEVSTILDLLDGTEEDDLDPDAQRPLPVLAQFATQAGALEGPYDVVVQPPELLSSDAAPDEEEREEAERWAYDAHFDVTDDADSPNVDADVYHRGDAIGTISIAIDASDPTDVTIEEVETEADDSCEDDHEALLDELEDLCARTRRLKVYYDSGHTLSDGALYSVQFRDQSFSSFFWTPFGDAYDVTKEKPSDFPPETGADLWDPDDRSLFRWVYEHWPPALDEAPWANRDDHPQGWLAIDDGAMEIADFIHLDPHPETEVLSLIHVKGSGSDSPNREISVANYEVVTGQAVKNLRNLEHEQLSDQLIEGLTTQVGDLVWKDGERTTRQEMVGALRALGSDFERRVVVLQPHIRKSYYEETRQGKGGQNETRLKQLDALLNGAEQACNGLGAQFFVLAADDTS